jgi:hypothetical protein
MASTAHIPLRRRDGSVRARALVDAEDYEVLSGYRWHQTNWGYVVRNVPRSQRGDGSSLILMHRQIMGLKSGDRTEVDHINRDRLDNRRANLRLATRDENAQNISPRGGRSRHRGVAWHKQNGVWRAYISVKGRHRHLGCFEDEDEAGAVAAQARRELMPFAEV